MAVHQCPGVALRAIDAGYTQIKLGYFGSSSKLGLPMFYVEEDGEVGSNVPSEAVNSSEMSVLEPGSG